MSNIIDKIQLSGITYDIGGGSITIDPTLDSGSTNPVANSAITTALDEKVNVADNIVSAATINYTYDVGDTSYKYPYNKGLIINEFYVKPVNQYTYTNTAAWNYVNISNGDSYTEIKVSVDCSNYKITAVTSTSGENFTYAIEDGVLHVTLSEGYTVRTIGQSQVFQISYEKYTIESGQTADVINEDLIDVIQDIYDQVPKAYLSAVTPNLSSTMLTILNTKSDGTNSGKFISFGSSIKGDNNKLDAYLPSRYITNVTLNTGNSNYCQVPSSTVNDYNTGFAYMDLAVNTGYTGSSTSFTFTVKTLFGNNTVQTDTFTYDVANKTIGGNQLYIYVYCYNNTITINPKQYNISRIQSVSESNCKICGVDSPFKTQYIITGVTAASYARQANTVINEIYSELNSKASTTYVDYSTSGKAETTAVTEAISEATSGKVDTSVYTAYTAATDTVLSGKQDTLVSGTNIKTINNESILGSGNIDIQGGGKAVSGGTNISITTGETADTINCTLNISNGTGGLSIKSNGASSASANHTAAFGQNTKATNVCAFAEGWGTTASGGKSHSEGDQTVAKGGQSHAEGSLTNAIADHSHSEGYASSATSRVTTMVGITTPYGWNTRHSEGYATVADNGCTHTEGLSTKALNVAEHSSGAYNVSYTASTTWGDSGNTLFSVGNGTADNARHNAFEIRQNGDIYLSSGGTDIKLQDHLGGGGGNPTVELTQAEYDALVTAGTVSADTYYIITDAQAGDLTQYWTSAQTNSAITQATSGKVATSAITTAITSSPTDSQIPSAKAVYDKLGGLSLIKLTQSAYDALSPNYDSNTLYVIVN